MRLVIATPLYPPEIGGPSTYAKLLSDGLPGKGIEVTLVKFADVRHYPKVLRHIAYYWRVLKALQRADAVLALDPVSVGLPALWAARRMRKPFLVKIVGDYAWEQGQQRFGITQNLDEFVKTREVPLPVRILRYVERRVALGATHIITPSQYLKSIVQTWSILEDGKFTVIPNVVSLASIGNVPTAVTALARPLVVTAGRLVPWKHIDESIRAVTETNATFAIVGDGPDREMLTRLGEEKLTKRAVFTGALSHPDTLATIRSADMFVLNSSYEGLSHLLIEALSLGVPIITTRVGGNPEVITDQKDGLLVTVGDTQALAQAIKRVLGDEGLRAELSRGALESAKRYSVDSMIDATVALLKQI